MTKEEYLNQIEDVIEKENTKIIGNRLRTTKLPTGIIKASLEYLFTGEYTGTGLWQRVVFAFNVR